MELDLTTIEALMQLVVKHKLDSLKYGDLILTKSKHEQAKTEANSSTLSGVGQYSDEDLYYSATGPSNTLTPDQVSALSNTPPKTRKSK